MAKESVVSTLAVLSGVDAQSEQMLAAVRGYFPPRFRRWHSCCLCCSTCPRVAFAAMRREMESGRAAFLTVLSQTGVAWLMATAVFQIGRLLGLG